MAQNKAKMHLDDLNMFQDNENDERRIIGIAGLPGVFWALKHNRTMLLLNIWMYLQTQHNEHFQPALFYPQMKVPDTNQQKEILWVSVSLFLRRDGATRAAWLALAIYHRRTWNDPSACWHAPHYGCLFLQGSQVILASSLTSSNLKKPVTAEL